LRLAWREIAGKREASSLPSPLVGEGGARGGNPSVRRVRG
jgi:hypothetical protein